MCPLRIPRLYTLPTLRLLVFAMLSSSLARPARAQQAPIDIHLKQN